MLVLPAQPPAIRPDPRVGLESTLKLRAYDPLDAENSQTPGSQTGTQEWVVESGTLVSESKTVLSESSGKKGDSKRNRSNKGPGKGEKNKKRRRRGSSNHSKKEETRKRSTKGSGSNPSHPPSMPS